MLLTLSKSASGTSKISSVFLTIICDSSIQTKYFGNNSITAKIEILLVCHYVFAVIFYLPFWILTWNSLSKSNNIRLPLVTYEGIRYRPFRLPISRLYERISFTSLSFFSYHVPPDHNLFFALQRSYFGPIKHGIIIISNTWLWKFNWPLWVSR